MTDQNNGETLLKQARKSVKFTEEAADDTNVTVPVTSGLSREELQAKLQAKVQEFKQKRGADAERNKKKQAEQQKRREKNASIKKSKKESVAVKKQNLAAAVVESGKLIFSKFDFGLQGQDEKKKSVTPKNPKQALLKAVARAEKLQQVASVDAAKAEQMQRSDAWAKAIQKAQGLIVKDDTKLLKKSIKRLENAKEKRAERWKEREESTKEGQMARQKKRQENLDARKEQKKNKFSSGGKKSSSASKGKGPAGVKGKGFASGKGKSQKRPGFEGGHFLKKAPQKHRK